MLAAHNMDQQIRFCTTSDGVRVAYAVTGEGYPLVWIPGWLSHAEIDWDVPVLGDRYKALTRDFTLYRIDKRGTGLSARKLKGYSREAWVLDVEAVVEHAGLERFALAGYSEGGPVAVQYAGRHPEKVSHVILMGSGARDAEAFPELENVVQAMATLIRTNWGSATKMLTDFFIGEDVPPEAQQHFAAYQQQAAEAEDAAAMLADIAKTFDIAAIAPRVQASTLLIHGRSDKAVPIELAQRLAALIPNSSFKSIAGHHVPNQEQSAQMVTAIREFILGPVTAPAEPERPPAGSGAPLTILFTDMESSSALRRRLGDASAQELVRTHNAIVRGALSEHGGSEIKHTGDGIMASFPSASSGLRCAAAIQQAVAAHVEEHPDQPLAVYIGLNAGEPIAEDRDLFGTSVDLARRICDHAGPGQVLVADVVRQLAAGKGFLFADIGEVVPKGFEEPVHLYEVRWQE